MCNDSEHNFSALLDVAACPVDWDNFNEDCQESLSAFCPELFQLPAASPQVGPSPHPASTSSAIEHSDPSEATTIKAGQPTQDAHTLLADPAPATLTVTAHSEAQPSSSTDDASKQQNLSKQPSAGKASRYDDDFKLQRNREAQKRFRIRHKAKSKDTAHELAQQRAELEELRQKQQRLEARNILLERLTHINHQQQQQQQYAAMDQGNPNHGSYAAAAPFVPKQPLLTLTIRGRPQILTREDINQLTFPQFAALYTEYNPAPSPWSQEVTQAGQHTDPRMQLMLEYNRAIGACFLELTQAGQTGTLERMQQLTVEALVLAGRVMLVPGMHSAIINGQLDTGGPALQKPDASWYQRLLFVFNLSEHQCRDLMYLRQLNLHQRCALSSERKAIMAQMAESEEQALVTANGRSENLVSVSNLAACLQKNASEDRLVYYQLARALYQGVLTTEQLAEGMLQSYPHIALVESLLDALAAQRGEPTKEELVAAAQMKPAPSEWHRFVEYVQQFDHRRVHEYVPVLRH